MCLQEFMYRLKQEAGPSHASVAQLAEQRAFTPKVAGSMPAGGTRKFLNRVVEREMVVEFETNDRVQW